MRVLRFYFQPKTGSEFVKIKIKNCSVGALNNEFSVTGNLKATPNGATFTTTHVGVTARNPLKIGGNKAGLQGSLTLGMSTPVADGEAISVTTK